MDFELFKAIKKELINEVTESRLTHGILELKMSAENFFGVVSKLKTSFDFNLLLDLTAIDYLKQKEERFDVIYHLYSTLHLVRVRLKISLSEENAKITTLTTLYGSANFMERECHEMYGIDFVGNDDLRPILLYNGFEGYPLRKDYPIEKEQPLVPYIK